MTLRIIAVHLSNTCTYYTSLMGKMEIPKTIMIKFLYINGEDRLLGLRSMFGGINAKYVRTRLST